MQSGVYEPTEGQQKKSFDFNIVIVKTIRLDETAFPYTQLVRS